MFCQLLAREKVNCIFYQYCMRLPDCKINPQGILSKEVPSSAIVAANKEVRLLISNNWKCSSYHKHTPKECDDNRKICSQKIAYRQLDTVSAIQYIEYYFALNFTSIKGHKNTITHYFQAQ